MIGLRGFVGEAEDVSSTWVELPFDAANDPITRMSSVITFQCCNHDAAVVAIRLAAFCQDPVNKLCRINCASGVLAGFNLDRFFGEERHRSKWDGLLGVEQVNVIFGNIKFSCYAQKLRC
jgi:hypothetical protein